MKKIFVLNMFGLTILCQSVFGMNVAIDSTQDSGQNQTFPLCVDGNASQEDDSTVQYQTSPLYLDENALKDGRIVLYYWDKNGGKPTGKPIMLEKTSYIGTTSGDQNQVNFAILEDNVDHIHGKLHSDEIELDNEYEIEQRQQNFKQTQTVWNDMFVTFVKDQKSQQAMNRKLLVQNNPTLGEAMNGKLFEATNNGDLSIVQMLVDNGVDINIADQFSDTLLHVACRWGYLPIVEFLISKGADPNTKTKYGETPLHYASQKGHLPIVEFLISKGADPEAMDRWSMKTPLHYACQNGQLDIVECLISKNANIHAKDKYDNTPLHWACHAGSLPIFELLIDKGANTNAKNQHGMTPLHIACQNGHRDIVEYLISQGADPEAQTDAGKTPADLAHDFGRNNVVEYLQSQMENQQ